MSWLSDFAIIRLLVQYCLQNITTSVARCRRRRRCCCCWWWW